MRYVSHWPSLTPLLFLAVYLPRRKRRTKALIRLGRREWWPHWGVPPWNGRTLPEVGTRPAGGFRKLSAYTRAKVRGTRTPATVTSEGCSFCGLRGDQWAALCDLIPPVLVSSCTGPGWCTGGTATPGTNGGQLERAA